MWKAAYLPNERPQTAITAKSKNLYHDALLSSIDDVFPVAACEIRIALHLPSNLVTTALDLKYLKHSFIPATMTLVSESVQTTKPSENKLMDPMDVVHTIGCTTQWQKRLQCQTIDSHEVETRRKGWREAILYSFPSTHAQGYHRTGLGRAREWTPQDGDRLIRLIADIERHFDRELH